jgi:hypothetical protein
LVELVDKDVARLDVTVDQLALLSVHAAQRVKDAPHDVLKPSEQSSDERELRERGIAPDQARKWIGCPMLNALQVRKGEMSRCRLWPLLRSCSSSFSSASSSSGCSWMTLGSAEHPVDAASAVDGL